jgi:hypothetical protein
MRNLPHLQHRQQRQRLAHLCVFMHIFHTATPLRPLVFMHIFYTAAPLRPLSPSKSTTYMPSASYLWCQQRQSKPSSVPGWRSSCRTYRCSSRQTTAATLFPASEMHPTACASPVTSAHVPPAQGQAARLAAAVGAQRRGSPQLDGGQRQAAGWRRVALIIHAQSPVSHTPCASRAVPTRGAPLATRCGRRAT